MERKGGADEFEQYAGLEAELERAMRRVDAPQGFAERVMLRAEGSRRRMVLAMPGRRRVWVTGALAAGMLGGLLWGAELHARRERERAERQFAMAVEITDRALDQAREQTRRQLQAAGVELDGQ